MKVIEMHIEGILYLQLHNFNFKLVLTDGTVLGIVEEKNVMYIKFPLNSKTF